jgi:exonuclease III
MSCTVLRVRWFNIIVLNVHASNEKKRCYKGSFYEELEQVQVYVSKYQVKILLGDFNAKLGREDVFNPTS